MLRIIRLQSCPGSLKRSDAPCAITFAAELAQRNPLVRVNAVLPGTVMLPADMPEDEKRMAIAGTLVKREGRPHNVADAVAFLIGNDYVTGVCLPVDGGRTIYYEP